MARLKVKLFGEFRVWRGDAPIGPKEWGGQKPRSLLKLLLTRPGHTSSRAPILRPLGPPVPHGTPRGGAGARARSPPEPPAPGAGHIFSRDAIVEALWPTVLPENAERSLRVTISL